MKEASNGSGQKRSAGSASFLLAQLGAHAAARFAERLKDLNYAPYHAGVLRVLSSQAGISQQNLAKTLNMHASRLVAVLDELQERGLLERKPSQKDRRLHELSLSAKGQESLKLIGEASREHHRALMKGLSLEQQQQLTALLEKLLDEQGLARGVHPCYRSL